MKLTYISTLLLSVFLLGVRLFTNQVEITGHLKRNSKDTSAYVKEIAIIVKGNNKILAHTFTDKKGNFFLTFIPAKEKSFDFFAAGIAIDTVLIGSLTSFDSDTPELTFYIPALIRKNILGQTVCPKCGKADKVYKIKYGDGLPVAIRKISKSGDTTYSPIVKGHYNATTCIVGVATFYCDRDKVRF